MRSVLREWCSAGGALPRETEGTREMGIVDSLRRLVMERMEAGWAIVRTLGAGRDGDGDRWLALRALRERCARM
ncbi:hypothetical protein AAC387_Pa07g2251 [Persea americana]